MITTRRKPELAGLRPHHPFILAWLWQHRYATAEQFHRLFPEYFTSLRGAQRQLKQLATRRLVAKVPLRAIDPTHPHVFFITAAGLSVVAAAYKERTGRPWPGSGGERGRPTRGHSTFFMQHELAITDVDLVVARAAAARADLTLVHTERRYHLRSKRLVFASNGEQTAIEPDAGYHIIHRRNGRTWLDFVVEEVDRGGMSLQRIRAKLLAYQEWPKSLHGQRYLAALHQRYGDRATHKPNFRLLIVSGARPGEGDNQSRLVAILAQTLGLAAEMRSRIWLTTADAVPNIAGPVWIRARDVGCALVQHEALRDPLVNDPHSQLKLRHILADQLAAMRRYSLFPPDRTTLPSDARKYTR